MHRLQAFPHPELFVGLQNVRVFDADAAAVGFLQGFDDFLELGRSVPKAQDVGVEDLLGLGGGQAVVGQVEHRHKRALHHVKGIELGLLVAAQPIGGDQVVNAHLLAQMFAFDGGALPFRASLQAVAADALEVRDHPAVRNLGLDVRLRRRQAAEETAPLRWHAVRGG